MGSYRIFGLGGPLVRKRASVLVLVLGSIALISVLAVVYATVGNRDRTTTIAIEQSASAGRGPEQVADYIARVIADDTVATFVAPGDIGPGGNLLDAIFRAPWDYPSIDFGARVRPQMGNPNQFKFNPVGSYIQSDPSAGADRIGSDPFLSSGLPEHLNINSGAAADAWFTRTDWRQMSAVAPSGRPVNLNNLRGAFGATPDEMAEDLSLFRIQGGLPVPDPTAQTFWGVAPDTNIPAHWFSYQLYSALNDTQIEQIHDQFSINPGDPRWIYSQYADADGDGILDSRWFEMVDYDLEDQTFFDVITPTPGMRMFFAVKVDDLSARVNVNTAGDFRAAPTVQAPVGISTAEVDLLRLLALGDIYADTDTGAGESGYGLLAGSDTFAAEYPRAADVERFALGAAAYNSIRYTLASGQDVPTNIRFGGYDIAAYQSALGALALDIDDVFTANNSKPWHAANAGEWPPANIWSLRAIGRRLFTLTRDAGEIGYAFSGAGQRLLPTRTFGVADLIDLLAFNGLNDPRVNSSLEAATDGRIDGSLGPLRSVRMQSDERASSGLPYATQPASALPSLDIRRRLTTLSSSRPIIPGFISDPERIVFTEYSRPVPAEPDAQDMFEIYAEALMSAALLTDQAWRRDNIGGRLRNLFYGYSGPERAARLSAHLAVNYYTASLGRNDQPIVFTLLLDDDLRGAVGQTGTIASRPWPSSVWGDVYSIDVDDPDGDIMVGEDTGGASLDLGAGALASSSAGTAASISQPVVNIYGPTAQPFITEVMAMTVYTDAPVSAGGDNEFAASASPDPFSPVVPRGITIKTEASASNPDYLFQCVAFQIHNPFDTPIDLASQDYPYYLEFAGRFYALDGFSLVAAGGLPSEPVPGGVIYAVPSPTTARGPTIGARQTLTFVIFSQPIIDIENRLRAAAGFPSIGASRNVVLMGGFVRAHLAVDRNPSNVLIMSVDQSNGQQLPISTVSQSYSFFEPVKPTPRSVTAEGTDAGRIVRLWRAMKIGSDESGTNNRRENDILVDRFRVPTGTNLDRTLNLPNSRVGGLDGYEVPGTQSANEGQGDNRGFTIVTYAGAQRPSDPAYLTGGEMALRYAWPAFCFEAIDPARNLNIGYSDPLISRTVLSRADFNYPSMTGATGFIQDFLINDGIDSSGIQSDIRVDDAPNSTGRTNSVPRIGDNIFGFDIDETRLIRLDRLPEVRRPVDLFLPMAIGGWYAPDRSDPTNINAGQRVTLGESLAIAAGYDRIINANDPMSLIADYRPPVGTFTSGNPGPGFQEGGVLDRGRLIFDDFVPFYRGDAGAYTYTNPLPRYNDAPGSADVQFGIGAPLALRLLDYLGPVPASTGFDGGPIPGRININTADPTVLRTLPLLSPSDEGGAWSDPLVHGQNSDIAATMAAVRDLGFRQPVSRIDGVTLPLIDFSKPGEGRGFVASIPGLIERPGFRSVGEMIYARVRRPFAQPAQSIDRLGRNGADVVQPGLAPLFGGDDGVEDDPFEKLAIIAAAHNSVTVRSDTFAVWILAHGYRESDVTGLTPDTPMEPSIARRYLMIVDRSNVTALGQTPRIVSLTEVPVRPE